MSKVAKKAVAKKATKFQLKALCDGSHGIDGGIYTYAKDDIVKLSKQSHYDSMKNMACFSEV